MLVKLFQNKKKLKLQKVLEKMAICFSVTNLLRVVTKRLGACRYFNFL